MKNFQKLTLALALFVTCVVSSQKHGGIATYQKEQLVFKTQTDKGKAYAKQDPVGYQLALEIDEGKRELHALMEFTLKFDTRKSLYSREDVLGLGGNRWLTFAIRSGGDYGNYYTNLETKEKWRQVDNYGNLYLVAMNIEELDWKLTKETKKIGNFTCFKATAIRTKRSSMGTVSKKIIAWYTPQVPVPFGPAGYGNLPGLVVDIQVGDHRYHLKSLSLNPEKKLKIDKPDKGIKVTNDEFIDIGIEAVTGLKN